MTAEPFWARGDRPGAEEHAVSKMKQDIAATRLNSRGTGSLPLDHERAAFQLSAEERHNRATRPRSRRWKALTRIDEEIDRITQRHSEAIGQIAVAEENLRLAPAVDARTLAAWLAGGSKGTRPDASITERQRELDAARLLVAAVAVELDLKLEERLAHIERHRNRMLADCQEAVNDARKQLLEKVNELPELRQALLDCREATLWLSHYPEQPQSFGFETAVALGLKKPVETTIGSSARIEYASLLAALEADANTISSTYSVEQQKRGLGEPAERTPLREALWDSDPAMTEWKRAELERARAIGEYAADLNTISDEARDFRT